MLCAAARAGLIASLPLAFAVTPSPRWGHQAVYVSSQQAMYIVGGEVEAEGTQVTNDVLVLPVRLFPLTIGATLIQNSSIIPTPPSLWERVMLSRLTRSPR